MKRTILIIAAILFSLVAFSQTDSLYRGNSPQYHKSDSVGTKKYPSSYHDSDKAIPTDTIQTDSSKTTPVDSTLRKNSKTNKETPY